MMVDCALCGSPFYAPHSSTCAFYTPDVHRVGGVATPTPNPDRPDETPEQIADRNRRELELWKLTSCDACVRDNAARRVGNEMECPGHYWPVGATQPQPTDGAACLLKIGLNCPCADCQQAREITEALPPIEGDPFYLLLKENDQLAGAVAEIRALHQQSGYGPHCRECNRIHPCPTIAALDQAGCP